MPEVLNVIMRWIHISSMATLIGGILYGRLVLIPASNALAPDARDALGEKAAALFRPIVFTVVSGLVVSGIYNILSNPGHTPRYHMLLGVKLLLVLHVFAAAFLVVRPHNPRRASLLTGILISGLTIIVISAWLRRIF